VRLSSNWSSNEMSETACSFSSKNAQETESILNILSAVLSASTCSVSSQLMTHLLSLFDFVRFLYVPLEYCPDLAFETWLLPRIGPPFDWQLSSLSSLINSHAWQWPKSDTGRFQPECSIGLRQNMSMTITLHLPMGRHLFRDYCIYEALMHGTKAGL
jgi:hypothetical protein